MLHGLVEGFERAAQYQCLDWKMGGLVVVRGGGGKILTHPVRGVSLELAGVSIHWPSNCKYRRTSLRVYL